MERWARRFGRQLRITRIRAGGVAIRRLLLAVGMVLSVARAAAESENPASRPTAVDELSKLNAGERLARIQTLLSQGDPASLQTLLEAGETVTPELAKVFREPDPKLQAGLIEAATRSDQAMSGLEKVLETLTLSERSNVLSQGIRDTRDPIAGKVRELLLRRPLWAAELLANSATVGEDYGALGPKLQPATLAAMPQLEAPEDVETLDALAVSGRQDELIRQLSALAPEDLARWLDRVAPSRRGFERSDANPFWPPLLLAAAAQCLGGDSARAVGARLADPRSMEALLASAASGPVNLGTRGGDLQTESPKSQSKDGASPKSPAAESQEEVSREALEAALRSRPGSLSGAERKALEQLPVYEQGRLQVELVNQLASDESWPPGTSALRMPRSGALFEPPQGVAHPIKDLLIDWTTRQRALFGPNQNLVLCHAWKKAGLDCVNPLPEPCATK